MIGLIATKEGMTRVFEEDGRSVPVSVLKVDTNYVSQIKTEDTDGYNSIQLSSIDQKEKNQSKSKLGHFSKNNISLKKYIKEFKIDTSELDGIELGKEFSVGLFQEGQLVDVSGTSKGKGFAGTVKRWNFATQDATHGNSLAHRKPGSIGQCQTPGRVWKGKKMAGHMGNENKTTQNLKVVRVRAGTIRSPIWKGGGVTFAARSKSSNPKKINKKMYKSAMRSIFSSLAEENRILISEKITLENPKTKEFLDLMKKLKFEGGLIIVNELSENLKLASRNISNIHILDVNSLDPINLLRYQSVLISEDSLTKIEELLT